MNQAIEEYHISSSGVESYIFVLPAQLVYQHLSTFKPKKNSDCHKIVRLFYLVQIQDLNALIKIQDRLSSLREYQSYSVNVVPFETKKQIHEHISMMEKMNESQFQAQYIEMLDLLEKEIERGLIRDFCMKQLNWSEAKTNKLMEKEQVTTINKLLNYRSFNQLESAKIRQIWNFIQGYLNK